MPEKVDKIKLQGLQDRRRKLTEEDKEAIAHKYETGLYSLNGLAKEYNVSKKSILLIVNPESKKKNDQRLKEHWRDYADPKAHAKAIKKTRNYKKELLKRGELKRN